MRYQNICIVTNALCLTVIWCTNSSRAYGVRSDRRSNADLAKEIAALKLHNARMQATLQSTGGLDDHPAGQVSRFYLPSSKRTPVCQHLLDLLFAVACASTYLPMTSLIVLTSFWTPEALPG